MHRMHVSQCAVRRMRYGSHIRRRRSRLTLSVPVQAVAVVTAEGDLVQDARRGVARMSRRIENEAEAACMSAQLP